MPAQDQSGGGSGSPDILSALQGLGVNAAPTPALSSAVADIQRILSPSSTPTLGVVSSQISRAVMNSAGRTIGADQITSPVNITGTTSGTATTIIAGSTYIFDGNPVMAEFFCPFAALPSVAGATLAVGLFQGSSLLTTLAAALNPAAAACDVPMIGKLRFSPSSGAINYSIKAWVSSTTGTPNINAGTGTGGGNAPAYLIFTKA